VAGTCECGYDIIIIIIIIIVVARMAYYCKGTEYPQFRTVQRGRSPQWLAAEDFCSKVYFNMVT